MRRSAVVLIVIGLLAGSVLVAPAEGAQKKKKKKKAPEKVTREASGTYATPGFGTAFTGGAAGCADADAFGCVTIATGAEERYITVEIADDSGQPVAASVTQDLDGDSSADTSTPICGATEEPVAIEPGVAVNVFVWTGPCENGSPGFATSGTVNAVLSNLP